jgi:hypothetical protein
VFGAWWTWIGGSFGFFNAGNPDGLDVAESTTNATLGRIRGGNATTFKVGGTSNYMPAGFKYSWYALAGLA